MNPIIEEIVSSKHLAVVGVSDKKFGGTIYKTLKERGYAVYPVHPSRTSFEGDPCFSSLKGLPGEIKTAVIAVSPAPAVQVVGDAVAAGFTHLWFQQGKDFSAAISKAQSKGLRTVSRKCILMYAQPVTGGHAIHRFFVRLFGRL
jgi:uncharacterized protein